VASSAGIRVGRAFGAPVLLKPSWFAIALVVTLVFAPNVRQEVPGIGMGAFGVAFCFAFLLLVSVLVHELAHAAMAQVVDTPADAVVLDVWGGHTSFSVETKGPGRSFAIAVVGPASNAVIAALAFALLPALEPGTVARLLAVATVQANLFVAVFNALPGLPLDGGRVLESLVWKVGRDRETGTLVAGWTGRLVALAVGYVVLGLPPFQGRRLGLTGVVWLLLVAVLLWQGATQAIKMAHWRRRAPLVSARDLLRLAVPVPSTATLEAAATAAAAAGAGDVVVLDVYGRPAALVDPQEAASVPPDRAGLVRAGDVARVLPAGSVIEVSLHGEHLIEVLEQAPHAQYVVVDDQQQVVGVLAWDDVAAAVGVR
jgi:Zn-dependent protease